MIFLFYNCILLHSTKKKKVVDILRVGHIPSTFQNDFFVLQLLGWWKFII
jgi:hypothetical protein